MVRQNSRSVKLAIVSRLRKYSVELYTFPSFVFCLALALCTDVAQRAKNRTDADSGGRVFFCIFRNSFRELWFIRARRWGQEAVCGISPDSLSFSYFGSFMSVWKRFKLGLACNMWWPFKFIITRWNIISLPHKDYFMRARYVIRVCYNF